MAATIPVTPAIALGEEEIEERFIRAPGPGGQKVNKTASAVQLRFDARRSKALSTPVFLRLKRLAGRHMNRDGVIVITGNRHRSQDRNRQDARDRLIALIREAAAPPAHRRATKPSKGARQRRLDAKRKQAAVKKTRGRVRGEE